MHGGESDSDCGKDSIRFWSDIVSTQEIFMSILEFGERLPAVVNGNIQKSPFTPSLSFVSTKYAIHCELVIHHKLFNQRSFCSSCRSTVLILNLNGPYNCQGMESVANGVSFKCKASTKAPKNDLLLAFAYVRQISRQ